MITKDQVLSALSVVIDPDLQKDLVTLGMIEDVEITDSTVSFTLVLTTPACPLRAQRAGGRGQHQRKTDCAISDFYIFDHSKGDKVLL